jgi:hypothetical protein
MCPTAPATRAGRTPALLIAVALLAATLVAAALTTSADARTVKPYRSTTAGDLYRVGDVKRGAHGKLVGYERRAVKVKGLKRHLRHGVLGVRPNGRIVSPRRVAQGHARKRRGGRHLVVSSTRRPKTTIVSGPGAAASPAPNSGCPRPYTANSPWNTPVGSAATHPRNDQFIAALDPASTKLTSDPTQFTLPVYYATNATPTAEVTYAEGWFSNVTSDTTLVNNRPAVSQRVTKMPIPEGLTAAAGDDAQVIVINTDTGEEWNASHFAKSGSGYSAWNVGHYNIGWSGVPPFSADGGPYWLRGPGIPYLTGLVRPCEIAQGHIDHALAMGVPKTSTEFVYPGTRSDGQSPASTGIPEGTRLQLDPSISDDTIRSWGCTGACFTVAKTAQTYGAYVADTSGRPKLYFEFEGTAHWNGAVKASTVSPIPLSKFRAVRAPAH